MAALRFTSDLSQLVDGALRVVNMVQLFSQMEELSPKLKYEIARNSMMLVVFMEAREIEGKKKREDFLGRWAKRLSDFPTYESYMDYVKLFKKRGDVERFEDDIEGLLIQYRRKSEDDPPPSN